MDLVRIERLEESVSAEEGGFVDRLALRPRTFRGSRTPSTVGGQARRLGDPDTRTLPRHLDARVQSDEAAMAEVDRVEREFGDTVPYIEDAYRTIRARCGSRERVVL